MAVIGEYLVIKSLKRVRYKAKENTDDNTIKLPANELLPPFLFPPSIRISAPEAPMITPIAFLNVIGSFIIIAAKIIVTMGNNVITSDASMGDVLDNP